MIHCGIIMDPIGSINISTDTSFALLLAAQQRDWHLHYFEISSIFLLNGQIYGISRLLHVQRHATTWFTLGSPQQLPLNQLDLLFIRKDPPFDNRYLTLTHLLDQLQPPRPLMINRPQALRDCNEKLFATWFSELMPETLVTQQIPLLRQFHRQQGEIILKPLDGMGGQSVVYLQPNDRNAAALMELLTDYGRRHCMAQRYLPAIQQGDKRLLLIDGEPIPYCLARIPPPGELRGNLAAGGHGEVRSLTTADSNIAKCVGPVLKEKGLLFVGLDIIGHHLTEINVTSPTGLQAIENASQVSISSQLLDIIEQRLASNL